jgi:hypothetical protein
MAPATVLSALHKFSAAVLVCLGLALIYLGAEWVASRSDGGNWAYGLCLLLVGAQACLLASLGADEVAAVAVAVLWTVGAALLFLHVLDAPLQAYLLAGTALAQSIACLLAQALPRRPARASSVVFEPPATTSQYGALSSFVDPLSASSRLSPKTSPQLEPVRTPSPFGARASPMRPLPVSAALSTRETPSEVRASYRALLSKYDLDTSDVT